MSADGSTFSFVVSTTGERITSEPKPRASGPFAPPKVVRPWHTLTAAHREEGTLVQIDGVMKRLTIPKIIMQTRKSKTEIPEAWKTSPTSIAEFMPGWVYCLLDDSDIEALFQEYFPQYLDTLHNFPYKINSVDYVRDAWLYLFGGVYMDSDYELTKSLEDLFYVDANLPKEEWPEAYLLRSGNISSFYTNSFMAGRAGCKLWLDYLEAGRQPEVWWAIGKHLSVMNLTGPLALNGVVRDWKQREIRREEELQAKYGPNAVLPRRMVIAEIPSKKLSPCSVCDPKPCTREGAYVKNLDGCSWIGYDTMFYNSFVCSESRTWLLIFLAILVIVGLAIWLSWYFG